MWIFLAVPVVAALLTGAIGRLWGLLLPLALALFFCWGFYDEWWGNGYDVSDNPYLVMFVFVTIAGAWLGLVGRWIVDPVRLD